jgi:hypothetical protein
MHLYAMNHSRELSVVGGASEKVAQTLGFSRRGQPGASTSPYFSRGSGVDGSAEKDQILWRGE